MNNEDFQVKNALIEEQLKRIGREIKEKMPENWGFTIMMFDLNTNSGSMFYLSSAERGDMIKAMQEFISKQGLSSSK